MEKGIRDVLSVQSGEKATRLMQTENKLSLVVTKSSNKISIKKEIEKTFDVKVDKVNIVNKMSGERIAIVKLKPESNAMDLATKLGLV
jgi:large subunit ribosomal protein L23